MRSARMLLLMGLFACGPQKPNPPPPKDPPQVFLTAAEANVVGTSVTLSVYVVGCERVASLGLWNRDAFIRNVDYLGERTTVQLERGDFAQQYATLGIAPDLTLTAKATCDDGRANESTAAPVKFFPVARVIQHPAGQAVPDVFFAEGGLGGGRTSFVGCTGTQSGTALVRVDDTGEPIGANLTLPFACSYLSQFTDRNLATGKRWMWERGKGAFAFDQNLNITSVFLGNVYALGVGPDGDALIWDNREQKQALRRVSHVGAVGQNVKWGYQPAGILMGNPMVQTQFNTVVMPVFVDQLGQYRGDVTLERVDYEVGSAVPPVRRLTVVEYGFLNTPQIPPGVFNADGSTLFFSFAANTGASKVLACATHTDGCPGAGQRWESPLLSGIVLATVPFAGGTQVAAIGSQHLYFLDASTGAVTNFAGKPIQPDGALFTLGAQPGLGTDFYVLNGPSGGYPVEIVAVDSPAAGELFRYQMNGGVSPANALTMAIDDAGAAWLRIGLKLVKPLSLAEYRQAKGPNRE